MKTTEKNKIILSVLPHTEHISFDFDNWVYYLIFGFNIDFRRVFPSPEIVSNMSEDEFQSLINHVEHQGKKFERNVIAFIKNKIGSGLHIDSYQLYSSDGNSLKSQISVKIDNRLASIRKNGVCVDSEILEPTRPIIFSLPFTISPTYNAIFNRPSGISIFTKEYTRTHQKKILFFTLNTALNSCGFDEFEQLLVSGITTRKKISDLDILQMNWEKFRHIADTISQMCRSIFGSNQFSKNSSNLLKYGFSPNGSFLQLS